MAKFLDEQFEDDDVAEVVILGDLFDEWVIPTNQEPLNSFQAIYEANSQVIKPLEQLAARGKLTYVPGNHDMAQSTLDPDKNMNFMKTVFRGINYKSDGVYRSGKLVAEHGHRYCLFNAVDTWTNLPSLLPIGYFISRMVAYKVTKTGKPQDLHAILEDSVKEAWKDKFNFIKILFDAVADNAGLKKTAIINMDGIAGFPAPKTREEIGDLYQNLIDNWEKNRKDIYWEKAVPGELGDLSQAAYDAYLFPSDSGQNIVIFGQTHKADLLSYDPQAPPGGPEIPIDISYHKVYANCGAWVDSVQSTYVETQEDADEGKRYIRVMTYPDKILKRRDIVEL